TLDTNGVRGDEEGFDPTSIARYGLAADPGIDYTGQTSWSPFALSTGWTFTEAETWGTNFQYDDEGSPPRWTGTSGWWTRASSRPSAPSGTPRPRSRSCRRAPRRSRPPARG